MVAAKLRPPELQPGLVPRERVTRRLEHPTPLALVVAPPGFGKTTAVRLWTDTLSTPVGWLSVDALDAAPFTFWNHLVGAIRSVVPDVGPEPEAILAERPDDASFLTALIAGVASSRRRATIVLDDLGHLDDADALAQLAVLVERSRDRIRFVVTARADPALPIATWRSRGWVTDVREEHLRLTDDEALSVMVSIDPRMLHRRSVGRLNAHVGGWPLALHLSLLTIADAGGRDDEVLDIIRNDRSLTDMVADTILGPLSPGERAVALDLSVVDQFDAVLARVLAGDEVAAPLARLEHRRLLTGAVDAPDARRFHSLVRELLEDELRWSDPARHARLHRVAAEAMLERGDISAAHHHLMRAGDRTAANALVADPIHDLLDRGDLVGLRALVASLPRSMRVDEPLFALDLALGWLYAGRAAEAAMWCDRAEEVAGDGGPTAGRRLRMIRSVVAHAEGRWTQAWAEIGEIEDLGEHGLVDGPVERRFAGLAARICLSVGDLAAGRRWLDRARAVELPAPLAASSVAALDAELDRLSGRLRSATALSDAVCEHLVSVGLQPHPVTLDAMVTAAACRAAGGQLHLADELAAAAFADAVLLGLDSNVAGVGAVVAHVRSLRDGPAEALAVLRDVRLRLVGHAPDLRRQLDVDEALLHLRVGRADIAERMVDGLPSTPSIQLVRAEAAARTGRLGEVDALLEGHETWVHPQRLVAAILSAAADTDGSGPDRMSRVLEAAADEGWITPFLALGPVVERILLALPLERLHPALPEHLWTPQSRRAPSAPLVESMTPREQTILELLPSYLSYAQIAERLNLSVNTVKSNLKSIYRKLGVDKRSDAVDDARLRGLL